MTAEASHNSLCPAESPQTPAPSTPAVVAALGGVAAGWIAAGSAGLLAHPVRHALTWAALAPAIIAAWPARRTWKEPLAVVAAAAAAVLMTAPAMPVYNVLAVVLVLAALAWANTGLDGRLLRVTAIAVAVLAVSLLATTSIPAAWSLADALGAALGRLGEAASGEPLSVGATFGGVDFLVLMAALYVGWLASTRRPRLLRALCAAAAIAGGHLLYLVLLSYWERLYEALPPAPPPPQSRENLYIPPPWSWSDAARALLPWNLPLAACAIQLSVAAMMLRWADWLPAGKGAESPDEVGPQEVNADKGERSKRRQAARKKSGPGQPAADLGLRLRQPAGWAALALAALMPLVVTLAPGKSDLAGKTIVAYNQGLLDWDKPVHDRYGEGSAGSYGMLPEFVASLGGRLERSDDLAEQDLADADVLLLIHPVHPWRDDQIERIGNFVRQGGSLLVLAETAIQDGDLASSYNDVLRAVLKPPGIHVEFDSAVSETGNWQHAYTALAHPAVTGIGDRRNRFGIVLGPSIRVRPPARPILVGRWGWSDPGVDSVHTGQYRLDPGERLGDLVLAAEQPVGRGTVAVLSDTTSFSNQGNVRSYVMTGRLLAYLAGGAASPQAIWRQALGLLMCVALFGLIAWSPSPARLAAVAVVLALALAGSRAFTHLSTRVLPDGRLSAALNNVAYIDASHLEAYDDSGWGLDGIAALELTLMRNGYLPFLLPKLTTERLQRAGMLISIAPARRFSAGERAAVRRFVEAGGIFICMAGAERAGPVQPLLNDFKLGVPHSPVRPGEDAREPEPMGNFTTRYRPGSVDYDAEVMLHAGWPVECERPDWWVRGFHDQSVMVMRYVGRGKVVLIGDSGFAMNKNHSYPVEPFNARQQNAHFWRWLITFLTDQQQWHPPRPGLDAPAESGPKTGRAEASQLEEAESESALPDDGQAVRSDPPQNARIEEVLP